MSKSLIKRIISFGGTLLSFVCILFIKVKTSMITRSIDNVTSRGFFEFIKDASNISAFRHARIHMLIGFCLVSLILLYFGFLLVLELLHKRKLIKKFNLFTKVVAALLIMYMFVIFLAGVDQENSYGQIVSITLFGLPWVMALLFSFTPLASEMFIKRI